MQAPSDVCKHCLCCSFPIEGFWRFANFGWCTHMWGNVYPMSALAWFKIKWRVCSPSTFVTLTACLLTNIPLFQQNTSLEAIVQVSWQHVVFFSTFTLFGWPVIHLAVYYPSLLNALIYKDIYGMFVFPFVCMCTSPAHVICSVCQSALLTIVNVALQNATSDNQGVPAKCCAGCQVRAKPPPHLTNFLLGNTILTKCLTANFVWPFWSASVEWFDFLHVLAGWFVSQGILHHHP